MFEQTSRIDQIVNDVTCKEAERRARWIDLQIFQLLTPFQNYLIKSSFAPNFIKKIVVRMSGIEVVVYHHVADFGHTVAIFQHGKAKASRIFA